MPVVEGQERQARAPGAEQADADVRGFGQVLQHRQHPHGVGRGPGLLLGGRQVEGERGGEPQRLADRHVLAEVLARHLPGQHQPVGRLQRRHGIAREHGHPQDLEDVGVGPGDLLERFRFSTAQADAAHLDPGALLHLREVELEVLGQRAHDIVLRRRLLARQG